MEIFTSYFQEIDFNLAFIKSRQGNIIDDFFCSKFIAKFISLDPIPSRTKAEKCVICTERERERETETERDTETEIDRDRERERLVDKNSITYKCTYIRGAWIYIYIYIYIYTFYNYLCIEDIYIYIYIYIYMYVCVCECVCVCAKLFYRI